jgi:hypothetical protein
VGIVGIALKEANKKKDDKEIICYKIDIIKNDIDIVCVDLTNKEKLDKELGGTDEKIIFIQLSGKRFGLVTNLDSDKFLLFRASKYLANCIKTIASSSDSIVLKSTPVTSLIASIIGTLLHGDSKSISVP